MENYLKQNIEKLKREFEEELHKFIENLLLQFKKTKSNLIKKIHKNKKICQHERLSIQNESYLSKLFLSNRLSLLNLSSQSSL